MDNFDFGDGGAFPEIHLLQYPLGMGKVGGAPVAGGRKQQATEVSGGASVTGATSGLASSSALVIAQQNAVSVVENRQKPQETELAENDTRTAAQLALVIEEKVGGKTASAGAAARPTVVSYTPQLGVERTIQITEKAPDPLDPSRHKAKKVRREAAGDPAPIVRSPPRDDGGRTGGGATTRLTGFSAAGGGSASTDINMGPATSNWRNPRNLAIPLDQRKKQETTTTATLGAGHFALAAAMRAAADDVKMEQDALERDNALAAEEAQKQQEEKATKLAEETLQRQKALEKEAKSNRRETAEERQQRIEAEREERDRRRDEERRLRKNEATARRLGVSLEEVEEHQHTMEVFETDDRATISSKAGAAGSTADLYDSALFSKKKAPIGTKLNHDNIAAVVSEMHKEKESAAQQPPADDDDDVFQVSSALNRKRGRQ